MKRALVLGAGNACRSQMAASYLGFYAKGRLEVVSAGLEMTQPLNPYAVKAMAEDNLSISSHLSGALDAFAGQHFDYLITVCAEAVAAAEKMISYSKHVNYAIPDPTAFQGSLAETQAEFCRVRELVKKKMLKFIGEAVLESPQLAA